jgi:hypothetical protein
MFSVLSNFLSITLYILSRAEASGSKTMTSQIYLPPARNILEHFLLVVSIPHSLVFRI